MTSESMHGESSDGSKNATIIFRRRDGTVYIWWFDFATVKPEMDSFPLL